jgi:hypothetical protein
VIEKNQAKVSLNSSLLYLHVPGLFQVANHPKTMLATSFVGKNILVFHIMNILQKFPKK